MWAIGAVPLEDSLTKLDLSGCVGLHDLSLKAILNATGNLKDLALARTCLTDNAVPYILELRKLLKLNLRDVKALTDHGLCQLQKANELQCLIIAGCHISDAFFSALPRSLMEIQAGNTAGKLVNTVVLRENGPNVVSLSGSRSLVSLLGPGGGRLVIRQPLFDSNMKVPHLASDTTIPHAGICEN